MTATLPAGILERIGEHAKERGETVEGRCRAELVSLVEGKGAAEVPPA